MVDAYIRRLIKDGVALEFFPEGGRSRTGKLLPPKLGLLSLVVDAALGVPTRTTWFCPISIGYERFVEEKAFVRELSGGEKQKERRARPGARRSRRWSGRYGRLSVQFGKPLTLDDAPARARPGAKPGALGTMTPARRRAVVTRLGFRVMQEINAVTAVTPGSLVASALLVHDRRGLPRDACTRAASGSRAGSAPRGPASVPRSSTPSGGLRADALDEAVELFVRAEHVEPHRLERGGGDVIYVVPPDARMSLDLAKNVIIHFFAARAIVATALLAAPGPPLAADAVQGARARPVAALQVRVHLPRRRAVRDASSRRRSRAWRPTASWRASSLKPSEGAGALLPKGDDGLDAGAPLREPARELPRRLPRRRAGADGAAPRSALGQGPHQARASRAGEQMFLAGDLRGARP